MTQTPQYEPVVARRNRHWIAGMRHVPTGRVIEVTTPGDATAKYLTRWGARRAAHRVTRRMNVPDWPTSTNWESI